MTPLKWVRVRPPEGFRSAWAAPDGLRIYRAIQTMDCDCWRLELVDLEDGIEFDYGGISHEKTLKDCKGRAELARTLADGEASGL